MCVRVAQIKDEWGTACWDGMVVPQRPFKVPIKSVFIEVEDAQENGGDKGSRIGHSCLKTSIEPIGEINVATTKQLGLNLLRYKSLCSVFFKLVMNL